MLRNSEQVLNVVPCLKQYGKDSVRFVARAAGKALSLSHLNQRAILDDDLD